MRRGASAGRMPVSPHLIRCVPRKDGASGGRRGPREDVPGRGATLHARVAQRDDGVAGREERPDVQRAPVHEQADEGGGGGQRGSHGGCEGGLVPRKARGDAVAALPVGQGGGGSRAGVGSSPASGWLAGGAYLGLKRRVVATGAGLAAEAQLPRAGRRRTTRHCGLTAAIQACSLTCSTATSAPAAAASASANPLVFQHAVTWQPRAMTTSVDGGSAPAAAAAMETAAEGRKEEEERPGTSRGWATPPLPALTRRDEVGIVPQQHGAVVDGGPE